mmetsp:Transcript_18954/g.28040  ORF Transcript_18954/g.28040 Transcript_18954/m.28040 type:complete len:201 (+) Transcript_18954:643-1245(+)
MSLMADMQSVIMNSHMIPTRNDMTGSGSAEIKLWMLLDPDSSARKGASSATNPLSSELCDLHRFSSSESELAPPFESIGVAFRLCGVGTDRDPVQECSSPFKLLLFKLLISEESSPSIEEPSADPALLFRRRAVLVISIALLFAAGCGVCCWCWESPLPLVDNNSCDEELGTDTPPPRKYLKQNKFLFARFLSLRPCRDV